MRGVMLTQWACLHCQQTFETRPWARVDTIVCPHCGESLVRAIHVTPSPVSAPHRVFADGRPVPTLDIGFALLMDAQDAGKGRTK